MQKIAIISDAWHPQVNGVVRTYEMMVPILKARGYQVSVIHPGLFPTMPFPLYPEIRLALFPKKRLTRMLRELQPDAIHIAVSGPLGFAARSICKREGWPFTTAYHTHFAHYTEVRFGAFFSTVYAVLRAFHNAGRSTMVATESLRKELYSHGFTNLALWPLGVDVNLFTRNPAPQLPPLEKPVYVLFGRLAPEKDPEEFLRLPLKGTKLIIGDGPERKRLEAAYPEARFVGYKEGRELVDWLSLCDVAVFPSRTETFGLVIVEALSCGIPVAAHRVVGPQDIITDGVDGVLGEDLKEAAEQCLTLDREACREKALSFSWERSTDAFVRNLAFRQAAQVLE